MVATGNITNNELLMLFDRYLEVVVESLARVDYVELRRDAVVVHERRDD